MNHLSPSSPAEPGKRTLSIAWKIWLAIAIIFGGFIIVLLQGAWVGQYTRHKNHLVTEHFFPATLLAQEVLSGYKAQLDEFKEAILTGEPARLKTGANHSKNIIAALERLAAIADLPPALLASVEENLAAYRRFADQALPFYQRMINAASDERILVGARELEQQAQRLAEAFTLLASATSQLVSAELRSITDLSERQDKTNLLVFLLVVLISSLLVAYILANSIFKPLQKTVALAHRMAGGDFSQPLDLNQNDEIGALAQAMNSMARQLDSQYQKLAQEVEDKTRTLQKANKQLRLEISQRKDTQHELLSAMADGEKANRAKSSFLAMMSHELRTPMNGIIGMGSLVLNTSLSETQRRYLTTMVNSAEALLTILNDILDFSKIEADKLQLESVDFEPRQLLDDVSDLLSIQAYDKGLEFFTLSDPAVPDWLQGDVNRLRQILINLAGNAIKFTESGEVAMRMEVVDRNSLSATIRFSISDTGIGIPADRLLDLFEPFVQADISTTRKFGGTGLGLAISKYLVELMGGKMHVESSEGEGSTFWFITTFVIPTHAGQIMPAKKDRPLIYKEGKAAALPPVPLLATGKRILVCDDDNTNLFVTQAILESFGCITDIAHSGQEALDRLLAADYDLIFMDIQMPVMDGIEATTIIRGWAQDPEKAKQTKSRTPIIALTADTSEEARLKFYAGGLTDYLGKPLRPLTLAQCLRKWLPDLPREKSYRTDTINFSRERLLQRLGGDQQKLRELTLAARIAIPRHLADLDIACTNHNCQLAEGPCLEIKKIAAQLGVASLQYHAIHLCMAMENADLEQIRTHYQQLKALLAELLDSMEG